MKAWWESLTLRERGLIGGGMALTLALLIYALAWQPFRAGYRRLQQSVIEQRADLAWMRQAAQEVQRLSGANIALMVEVLAAGLTGWQEEMIHVSVPVDTRVRPIDGVEHHHVRLIGDITGGALRRTKPEIAVVRAAQWARTDRQAPPSSR